MSDNIYSQIPVPVGDGVGAPISIIGQGLKTFVIGGDFDATVIIEVGIAGVFAPLYVLDKPNQFRHIPIVAEEVRVIVSNYVSGQAIVFIGGEPAITTFAALDVPLGNGVGVALDTSTFAANKTLIVGGQFDATLTYEVSESVAGPFAPLGTESGLTASSIDKTANLATLNIINRFIRVRVSKYKGGVPLVKLGVYDDNPDSVFQELYGQLEKCLFIIPPSQAPQTTGDHVGLQTTQNGSAYLEFRVPDGFVTLLEAKVLVIPPQTHFAADIDLDSNYALAGEQYNMNSETNVTMTFPLTLNTINEIDVSSVLTGISPGNLVGLKLDNNVIPGGYLVLGMHFLYK